MNSRPTQFILRARKPKLRPAPEKGRATTAPAAGLIFAVLSALATTGILAAQTPSTAGPADATTPASQTAAVTDQSSETPAQAPAQQGKPPRASDRRRAAKLYVESSKLFVDRQFEAAMKGFAEAAALDPTNNDYRLAVEVTRSHAATALIQEAAKDRLLGNETASRNALLRALAIDPANPEATQHLDEVTGEIADEQPASLNQQAVANIAGPVDLAPSAGTRSFHVRSDQRQIINQVFHAYGITAMLDQSVRVFQFRLDLDDATFDEAMRALSLATNTFYVPVDAHRAVVAADTRDNRRRFTRQDLETVYLAGLSDDDLTQVTTIAKNAFGLSQTTPSLSTHTITLRGPESSLNAFNSTMRSVLDGRSQVLLDIRLIQIAHTSNRNTGAQLPQSISAFNVYAEEQSLLSQNQSLVQEIISSGLAAANDPLAILGILIASGQVSSSLLSNGFALFGGGITQSALSPNTPMTVNLNLNTSDSRELDEYQLRMQDGEEETLKEGEKYPIQTSSFSSLSPTLPNIPGLTGAGTSSSLGSLLSSLSSSVPNIPMVQYQDLGLTLTTRPRVLRDGDVALSLDLKLDALSGTSIGGNPVLDNRAYSGVTILKEGEAAVVATEVDKSQSLAISGTPGLSEIPGMNNLTGKDLQQNYATIVIVITPHVVRGPQAAGHTAMMRVEKSPTQP